MKVKIKEVFMRHGAGLKRYPFAFGEVFNTAGVSLGSGFVPNGDAIYNSPQRDEADVAQIFDPVIDPPFLYDATLATGIRINDQW